LKECVLFLLNFHRGRDQAISRDEFLHQLPHGSAGRDAGLVPVSERI
jgi:hypothetical protein